MHYLLDGGTVDGQNVPCGNTVSRGSFTVRSPPSVLVAFSTRSTLYHHLYVGHVALSYVLFWIPILFIPIHQQRLTRVNDDGYISFALKWRPCQCHGQCIPRPFFLLCLSRSTKGQAFSSNTLYWRCIIATARSEPLYVTDFGQSTSRGFLRVMNS